MYGTSVMQKKVNTNRWSLPVKVIWPPRPDILSAEDDPPSQPKSFAFCLHLLDFAAVKQRVDFPRLIVEQRDYLKSCLLKHVKD